MLGGATSPPMGMAALASRWDWALAWLTSLAMKAGS